MRKIKVLVVGGAFMELSMNMYKVPSAGETVTDDGGVAYVPGGSAVISSAALSRLGADTHIVSRLGRDLHGQKLYQYFRELGVGTGAVKVDAEKPTGLSVIIKEADMKERRVVYPGAAGELSSDDIGDGLKAAPDAVYLNLDLPEELINFTVSSATVKGVPVFVNAGGARDGFNYETLPFVEVFSTNVEKTEKTVGIRPIGADSSLRAALALYKKVRCRYLVIRQGERGAFIYDGKHYFMIPPINAGKPAGGACAGDAFFAGVVIRYLLGAGDIKSAVQYGSVVGALAVTRRGGISSLPTEADVTSFLEKYTG
ncbi:MAG: hypothetical protein IJW48_05185 [Clostridia bacterium]|nr:hypothetical protein [Clostridia bacterium]